MGQRLQDLVPLIYSLVPKRISNKRTVQEALMDLRWVHDIHGVASMAVIAEFISLCDLLACYPPAGRGGRAKVEAVKLWPILSPPDDVNFEEWWSKVANRVSGDTRKGLNSIIILGAWTIWRHRNECVFNGKSPSVAAALIMAGNERDMWGLAGARALVALLAAVS
ncbi:hypothetical protein PR202_gn00863 [Eleusine coracana subsp. coracana]|uniref:Uncharacterized protein n=1 Tax=Eleusine coracana subsp. coracana TaxID=191504 RepID=A0AAV5G3Q7_ELECO|nr:hypothetical protein PR202_gn00863 [Eleusine coracana subsp. coracana]